MKEVVVRIARAHGLHIREEDTFVTIAMDSTTGLSMPRGFHTITIDQRQAKWLRDELINLLGVAHE